MNAIGSDPRELRRSAAELDDMAASLHAAARSIHGLLFTTPWHGPFADGFRDEWSSRGRLYLNQAAGELERAAGDLRRNADEQDQASGAELAATLASVGAVIDSLSHRTPAVPDWVAVLRGMPEWAQIRSAVDEAKRILKFGKALGFHTPDPVSQGVHVWDAGVHLLNGINRFIDSGPNWWTDRNGWLEVFGAAGEAFSAVPDKRFQAVGSAYLFVYDVSLHPDKYVDQWNALTNPATYSPENLAKASGELVSEAVTQVSNACNATSAWFNSVKSGLGL
ncbi:MAG: hypothetical protein KGO50_18570 [Myxococcales bacterium]|nr:hypothetical protein [Myxococcales bacterium]